MVKLADITSMYEVALTMNFVLGYLIMTYRDIYDKSIKVILTETKGEEFSEKDNCFILKNGNKFSKKDFHNIKTLFGVSISLSLLAILTSFFILLFAGLNSEYNMPNILYIMSALLFIIINPIIYFLYKINVVNFQYVIEGKGVTEDEISDFMKNYVPLPVFKENIFQKLKWFFHFKIKYLQNILHRKD